MNLVSHPIQALSFYPYSLLCLKKVHSHWHKMANRKFVDGNESPFYQCRQDRKKKFFLHSIAGN